MHSPSYAWRGIAYMNLKEYEKAITDFDTAIKINSPNPGMYYKLRGETYSAIKDYEKAIKDFDSAIELEPEMLEAYFERGNAFRNQNKYGVAITLCLEDEYNYLCRIEGLIDKEIKQKTFPTQEQTRYHNPFY